MKISNHIFYIGAGDKFRKKSMAIANAMALELANYGVSVSSDLMHRISYNKKKVALKFCSDILKDYTVGKLNKPLFTNWESRTEFTFNERVIQILGYVLSISGNDLEDPAYMQNLSNKIEFKKEKIVQLAADVEAKEHFDILAKSKVALDRSQLANLVELAKYFAPTLLSEDRIYSDEARISVLLALSEDVGLYHALCVLKCKPSDVLRYAAALVDINTIKLPSDVKYATLTWKQRIDLLSYLDKFSYDRLFEDTGINRESWTRFYKHIHLFSQKDFINRFPTIGFVARVSMGFKEEVIPKQYFKTLDTMLEDGVVESTESENLVYRTFASRVKSAIESKDFDKISKLMKTNAGYLLRNLATVANGITKANEFEFIKLVREQLPKASVDVLFSIIGINVNAKYRVIDIKGNTVIEDANYPKFISSIQNDIKIELRRRYGLNGQIKVADDLKQKVVPFLSKNSELDRGSRIKLDGSKYLYMFVKWTQPHHTRTDLDLSVVSFDENWKPSTVYFGHQANAFITHSGDITNAPAPHGATEYVRINLDAFPKGTKYILPIVNVYCGAVMNANAEAYAGFMLSDSDKFSIERKHVRYDLVEPANSNIPFMLDVDAKEVMILDFNNRIRTGWTAHSEIDNMKKLISASTDKFIITIEMLADILSGDSDEVSLTIKKTATKDREIEPSNLSKLFNDL